MSEPTTPTRNDGPAPRALTEQELSRLLSGQQFGVLASVRKTGHPHLSTVLYDWDAEERVLRVSSTADRLKVRRLRRDPHASLHVSGPDVWSFAVAEGEAEIVDPADGAAPGEKPLPDRRVTILLRVSRLYGTALEVPAQD
ncbi:TIGR03618 family F420-dependent PPOX class oxidoreductase [Streptomyces sp. R302]|uniref:TIGR03618 family F420-dependent PPOX class oxidoreductase n=1 Tax=unclassified Streptomyces TaxID=2593676 RepID=UPI00145C9A53|nr:TIGR03618 family F420-dependent PPOX class oxidoreductase [Streptomyces sp. R301]NML79753.1 TIGR03618 family F420-dependent PPOX class oxidoreductase [Streptomyces sp. R302]